MRRMIPLFAALLAAAQVPAPRVMRPAPEQPLPFSHRTHISVAKLECKQCHTMPDPGDFAELPVTSTCMACHISVKKDSPHIQKLTAFHKGAGKVAWLPVYRIPDYVMFSHRKHVTAGATCQTCHGPVEERDVMRREKDISMAACMSCHKEKGASNACDFCHDPK